MSLWKPEYFSRPELVIVDMQNAFFETDELAKLRQQVAGSATGCWPKPVLMIC